MNRLIWLFLIATRLRDRLRCPNCDAVGTYKLHAPTPRWRWLCKYCGYYRDSDGQRWCVPSPSFGCWIFEDQQEGFKGRTPLEIVRMGAAEDSKHAHFAGQRPEEHRLYGVWPWRG